MCQTFYIKDKEIVSCGELKQFVEPQECLSVDDSSVTITTEDEDCLCWIDPEKVAVKLGLTVTADPAQWEVYFK